jgi:hypothetical protein
MIQVPFLSQQSPQFVAIQLSFQGLEERFEKSDQFLVNDVQIPSLSPLYSLRQRIMSGSWMSNRVTNATDILQMKVITQQK